MGWESLAQYNRVMFWFLLSQRMFPLALHRHHHCTHHMNTQKMSEANMSIALDRNQSLETYDCAPSFALIGDEANAVICHSQCLA